MIEVIFKIFLTDYIDFQGFITKRVQKPFLIEYKYSDLLQLHNFFIEIDCNKTHFKNFPLLPFSLVKRYLFS
jgi:hypothetical protein